MTAPDVIKSEKKLYAYMPIADCMCGLIFPLLFLRKLGKKTQKNDIAWSAARRVKQLSNMTSKLQTNADADWKIYYSSHYII